MDTVTLDKVTSRDGTPITYYRSGAGSPLILVSGAGAANPVAWTAVVPALEGHFSVYAVDRRGHGESGDGLPYAIEREFEDIAAVVDAVGEPVNLLGHSFGAFVPLELLYSRGIFASSFYTSRFLYLSQVNRFTLKGLLNSFKR